MRIKVSLCVSHAMTCVSYILHHLYYFISTHQGGLPAETLEAFNVDPDRDQVFLVYTGSRWLGVHFIGKFCISHMCRLYATIITHTYPYIGTKQNSPTRDFWRGYVQNFHAFWTNLYTTQTLFASDPTSKSSISE